MAVGVTLMGCVQGGTGDGGIFGTASSAVTGLSGETGAEGEGEGDESDDEGATSGPAEATSGGDGRVDAYVGCRRGRWRGHVGRWGGIGRVDH